MECISLLSCVSFLEFLLCVCAISPNTRHCGNHEKVACAIVHYMKCGMSLNLTPRRKRTADFLGSCASQTPRILLLLFSAQKMKDELLPCWLLEKKWVFLFISSAQMFPLTSAHRRRQQLHLFWDFTCLGNSLNRTSKLISQLLKFESWMFSKWPCVLRACSPRGQHWETLEPLREGT